jgi:hypothetical protein
VSAAKLSIKPNSARVPGAYIFEFEDGQVSFVASRQLS